MQLSFVCYSGSLEGKAFPVRQWPVSFGRHPRNTIVLADDASVSNHHCRVVLEDKRLWVYDLKSVNGTYLNGRRVEYRAELAPNASVLGVGEVKFGFVDASSQPKDDEVAAHLIQPESIFIPSNRVLPKAEEVVLVVDVAESTRIGREHGDTFLAGTLWKLGKVFEQAARSQQVLFMKCTGDGFLSTFESAEQALTVACVVLGRFARTSDPPLKLRFALHRGPVKINKDGDRFGLAVHLCVRLEGLKAEDLVGAPGCAPLPPVNRILVTDEVLALLPAHWRHVAAAVGSCTPRGFASPVNVHSLDWERGPRGDPALTL